MHLSPVFKVQYGASLSAMPLLWGLIGFMIWMTWPPNIPVASMASKSL